MNRREFLKKSAAAGAGVAVSSTLGLSSSRALGLGRSVTPQEAGPDSSFHCKWGAFALPIGGQKIMEALLALEQRVGRRFAIHRDYQGMDVDIISSDVIWLGNRGTIPYRSFHAWSGGKTHFISWAGIAAGKHDTWLKKQAAAVGAWGKPIYLSFHHEPEVWPQCGSPADFRAAWNHVRQIFHRVDNATWVVTLLSPTFYGNNGGPKAWLPSPANYDVLGVDGYNRYPCRGSSYTSFTDKFLAARNYALYQVNKAMFIGETGCVEQNSCGHPQGDPTGKAKWIYNMANVIKSWPRVIAVNYSHVVSGKYAFWVDTSPSALAAYRTVGADPYFK